MALQHFDHPHPLKLISDASHIYMEGRKEKTECECCGKPILSSAYGCTQCNYFLHTNCGTLPRVIKHHLHPYRQHLLTLYNKGTAADYASRYSYCILCFRSQRRFIYLCFLCGFNVHALCATLEKTTIEDKIHDHPLTFVQRVSLFTCDACGTEDEDFSYRCTSAECQFWIHASCASSVSTLHRNDHIHPLLLAYYIPYQLRNFSHDCYICEKRVYHSNWVYYCASCRYFAHLKCAKSKEEPLMLSEENLDPSIIHFPMPDEESLFQLMIQILTKKNSSSKGSVMVDTRIHNCHYYPLIDFEDERSKEMKNEEMLCDVCVRPISFPFYTCVKCSFTLHKSCSHQLALKKEKPDHPEHPIDLSCPAVDFNYSYCSNCSKYTNSFCNECTTCTSFLGVCCASTCLPITIKHEAHKHPLRLLQTERFTLPKCTACDQSFYREIEYRCATCNFHLEIDCAKLPGTVKHEWDRHPLSLTYPPFDHPDDYFCEICEEDIHPNHWLYHCRICDQSFHTKCVCPPNDWSNVKFGGIYKFEHHPHNLRLVPSGKKGPYSHCDHCGESLASKGRPVLECTSCSFQLGLECVRRCSGEAVRVKFPLPKCWV